MCATIIAILSYSFQLAGALLLLLWCIRKCDTNVIKGCFENHANPLWMEWDKDGEFTRISKEDLQDSAKNVYLNIATFADLVIGYTMAIFMTDVDIPRWCLLIYVLIAVILILGGEYFGIDRGVKKKYNVDRKVYNSEHSPRKGDIAYKITSVIKNQDNNQK